MKQEEYERRVSIEHSTNPYATLDNIARSILQGGSYYPDSKNAGISLRDKIAMQCLEYQWKIPGAIEDMATVAALCYSMADAMMEARGAVPEDQK